MSVGALAQLIATPWLARLYTPLEFGFFAIFSAVASVVASASCLRHDVAILVVRDDEAASVSQLALLYVLGVAAIGGVLAATGVPSWVSANYAALDDCGLQLAVAVVGGGALLVACGLSMRREEYVLNALMRSIQGPVYVLSALFLPFGLVNGWVAGWLFAAVIALAYVQDQVGLASFSALRRQAFKLKHYALNLTPTFLLDSFALILPVFVIGNAYGPEVTGNYSQVTKLIGAPLLLVSAVVGQIFIERSGKLYRRGESSLPLFCRTLSVLGAVALVVLAVVGVFGDVLVGWILGAAWRTDRLFVVLISVPILCKVVVSPTTTIFLTHHRTAAIVQWQSAYFLITLLALSLAGVWLGIDGFLMVYAINELILYATYGVMAYRVAKAGEVV